MHDFNISFLVCFSGLDGHIKNIYLSSQFEAWQAATFIHNVYDSYTRSMTVTDREIYDGRDGTYFKVWRVS